VSVEARDEQGFVLANGDGDGEAAPGEVRAVLVRVYPKHQ
jgi:hypothetical protein